MWKRLLPEHCAICREVGIRLCERCTELLAPPPDPDPGDVRHLDDTVALFAYVGAGRTAIARLKFDNHRDAMSLYAYLLAGALDGEFDVVTWVPTSAAHRRQRGYDQAELLARAVARELRLPARATLRSTQSEGQRGRTRAERRTTSFEATRWATAKLQGASVALVDDVRTTGASLDAAARTLRRVGAHVVVGGTIAATPNRADTPT